MESKMKFKKKYVLIPVIVLVILCVIYIFYLFSPHPVIEDPDASNVLYVEYLNTDNAFFLDITDYDEEGILHCLARHQERRILHQNRGYMGGSFNNLEFQIWIEYKPKIKTKPSIKCILIGDSSYSDWDYIYKFLDVEKLRLELLEFIYVPSDN